MSKNNKAKCTGAVVLPKKKLEVLVSGKIEGVIESQLTIDQYHAALAPILIDFFLRGYFKSTWLEALHEGPCQVFFAAVVLVYLSGSFPGFNHVKAKAEQYEKRDSLSDLDALEAEKFYQFMRISRRFRQGEYALLMLTVYSFLWHGYSALIDLGIVALLCRFIFMHQIFLTLSQVTSNRWRDGHNMKFPAEKLLSQYQYLVTCLSLEGVVEARCINISESTFVELRCIKRKWTDEVKNFVMWSLYQQLRNFDPFGYYVFEKGKLYLHSNNAYALKLPYVFGGSFFSEVKSGFQERMDIIQSAPTPLTKLIKAGLEVIGVGRKGVDEDIFFILTYTEQKALKGFEVAPEGVIVYSKSVDTYLKHYKGYAQTASKSAPRPYVEEPEAKPFKILSARGPFTRLPTSKLTAASRAMRVVGLLRKPATVSLWQNTRFGDSRLYPSYPGQDTDKITTIRNFPHAYLLKEIPETIGLEEQERIAIINVMANVKLGDKGVGLKQTPSGGYKLKVGLDREYVVHCVARSGRSQLFALSGAGLTHAPYMLRRA